MGERSIKVTIAGRSYPITVSDREEPFVHEAVKKINDKVKHLESAYSVKDKQDLLAMVALQFATQYLETESKVIDDQDGLLEELTGIDAILTKQLG